MRLSDRITALCRSVQQGESIADIGTDHGYVPLLLYRDGVSPKTIMSDISEDSLAKAKESFALAGIEVPGSWFRVGDGLNTIDAGEVDDVIIAGLGGNTIISIIDSDADKSRSFRRLILQPRKYSGELRHFLYVHGYDIIDEKLAPEGKFICEVISAEPSETIRRPEPYERSDIRWLYPESLKRCDRELLSKRLEWKLSSIDRELKNLANSRFDQSEKTALLMRDRSYLEGLLG